MSDIQVIPAVLEQEFAEIEKKVAAAKGIAPLLQLDVMDGRFVGNTTFNDIAKLAECDTTWELHLMIEHPEFAITKWSMPNVQRMIVHKEAVNNMQHVIDLIRKAGKEVGIALNPQTSTHEIKEYVDQIDLVLVMGVNPGWSGQDFHYDVLEKIKELKAMREELIVAVDGGVNMKTRNKIVEAGADVLCAYSAVWKAEGGPAAGIDMLKTGERPQEEA